MTTKHVTVSFQVSAVILLAASTWLVVTTAVEEPYSSFDAREAFLNIGLGTTLIAYWIIWGVGVAAMTFAGRFRSTAWFALLLPLTCILYLWACPAGYLEDMHFVINPR